MEEQAAKDVKEEPHPAERGNEQRREAQLAHRLQHLKTVRAQQGQRAYWARELAMRAREEYIRQRMRERGGAALSEEARRRLERFQARLQAARPLSDQFDMGKWDGEQGPSCSQVSGAS